MYKVLVVDDELDVETLIRQKFRRKIRKKELEFQFAHNGLEALEFLLQDPDITLIMSDINMPDMDGLTLLGKLHEMQNPLLKTIIVSAYGDMENIRTAMNRGAFDFVTKPIDFDDLETTITKTLSEIGALKKSLEEHEQLLAIRKDLDVAREIQSSILPQTFPPYPERTDFDLFASMNAAKSVGGDFYDFFLIDENHLGFVIADVSGKGVPAAIFMAVSRTLLKAVALEGKSPEECLYYSNNLLCKESVDCMFVTVFYGVLNTETGEMHYANGGHNPPFIVRNDGSVEEIPQTGGMALGFMPDVPYKGATLQVGKGDSLYLFTDGVNEAMDIEQNQFGNDRLIDVLKKDDSTPKCIVDNMCSCVTDFTKGAEQSDDITMLCVKYNG